jgi:hypothetical protein
MHTRTWLHPDISAFGASFALAQRWRWRDAPFSISMEGMTF